MSQNRDDCCGFMPFIAPDITKVNPKQTRKFSSTAPAYRTVGRGFNLEGRCKNKKCQAFNKLVWTPVGYGTFFIGELIHDCKCPSCSKPTGGNKMFGVYKAEVTGYGKKRIIARAATDAGTRDTDDEDEQQQENQKINFQKIVVNEQDGFLKMDGKNGRLVQWYYMTLTIAKIQSK